MKVHTKLSRNQKCLFQITNQTIHKVDDGGGVFGLTLQILYGFSLIKHTVPWGATVPSLGLPFITSSPVSL